MTQTIMIKYDFIVYLLLFCFIETTLPGQAAVFQKKIKDSQISVLIDMYPTHDSGYVLAGGHLAGFDYGDANNFTIQKLDEMGNVQWSKDYGSLGTLRSFPCKIQETRDSGYVAVVVQESGGGTKSSILKTNKSGNVQWLKKFGEWAPTDLATLTTFRSMQQTADGGYIIAGETNAYGAKGINQGYDATDVYLVKLSSAGNVEWTRTYGNIYVWDWASSVQQTVDGGFIVAGQAAFKMYNGSKGILTAGFLVKTGANGNLQWSRTYGVKGLYFDPVLDDYYIAGFFYSVRQTADKGYIATGGYGYGPWAVRTDSMGNFRWSKEYTGAGPKEFLPDVRLSEDGYVFNNSEFVFKTDTAGEVQWKRSYGTAIRVFTPAPDGGYAVAGSGWVADNVFIAKADSSGKTGCQNTRMGVYTIPTVTTAAWAVSVDSGYVVTSLSLTPTSYSATVVDTCIVVPITALFYVNSLCDNDSANFVNLSNAGLYTWDFGDPGSGADNFSTLENPRHKYAVAGTYTVTLKATDGDDLSRDSTYTKILTIYPARFISAGSDVTVCSGDSTLLIAAGTWELTGGWFNGWYPADSLRYFYNDTTYAYPDTTTRYVVSAWNNSAGCLDSDSLTVTVIPPPIPAVNGNTTICQGTTTTLSAVGYTGYLWSTGQTTAAITIAPVVTTTYSITTYDGACTGVAAIPVAVTPNYTVDAGENVTLINGTSVVLAAAAGSDEVTWLPVEGLDCSVCLNPKASPAVTTTYYVTTEALSGCFSLDSITVYVLNCGNVFVPTAFSPNSDGANDVLYLKNDCIKELDFKIYDRWGNRVFQAADINEGWDGTYKGKPLDTAVLVYYINAVLFSGETISEKGNISLIR